MHELCSPELGKPPFPFVLGVQAGMVRREGGRRLHVETCTWFKALALQLYN